MAVSSEHRLVADYRIVRRLGEGSYGSCYLAWTPDRLDTDAEHVALKVMARNTTDEDFQRVAAELAVVAGVGSPQLVRLFDVGHQDGLLFIASEYLVGGSLATPARPLSRDEVLGAVADAARGAHALHDAGLAHRDIKPANVMLRPSGAALGDLGLAHILNPGMTVTGTGPIVAIEYVDPTVLQGEPASRASDIWSLGVTLHRALTGRGVYGELREGSVMAAIRTVLGGTPELDPELYDDVRDVIAGCLSPDPADRLATASALADRIDALVAA